ncbi:DUF192 domain-containing protein [Fimbriimonas ginsengisoli]|uniref:DUF192 domain-containing protein n=1 Tax=Fimbriimonas ginsengisoli Gsoil 348 TaxID=661478 RepID=A0A068NYR4_FIMGI|nr:DUF192 domain-containing protein [Fimbriimonas ginsengisoli]AIE87279.1 hypothetical protein OP10G_3911 [Fimbriimonas ginsengisoli Gsoil 348]
MKPAGYVLFALIALVGCNPSKDVEPAAPPKTETATTAPKTEPPKTTPAPAVDEHANADRAFQLKDLETKTVKVNGKPIQVWVMDTGQKRQEGMMFLTAKDVRDDQGMIFVSPRPSQPKEESFWMHNTILPLDIIYIGSDKSVINIQKGKPQDDTQLPAAAPFLYVIELKQGQAEKYGIKPGTKIDIPNDIASKD